MEWEKGDTPPGQVMKNLKVSGLRDLLEQLADGRLRQVLPDCQPQVRFGQHLYACYTPSRVQLPKVQVFLAALEDLLQPEPPWRKIWPGPG